MAKTVKTAPQQLEFKSESDAYLLLSSGQTRTGPLATPRYSNTFSTA